MGLDLEPCGRPKPGHEAEWKKLMRTPLFMRPEEAVAYGEELLAVARKAAATKLKPSRGPWGARKPEQDSESGGSLTYEEQLDVLRQRPLSIPCR